MKPITINMFDEAGPFCENKDKAKKLRTNIIIPAISQEKEVIIDFAKVEGATQSFIHALTAEPIRDFGDKAYNNLIFSNCNKDIMTVIDIVYEYLQES